MGNRKRGIAHCAVPVLCLLLFPMLLSCSAQKERIFKKSKALLDTLITIQVVADRPERAEKAIDRAFAEVKRLGDLLNFYSEESELAKINRSAGISDVKVSPETLGVIEKAVSASENTGGAFDITIGPEIILWDFAEKRKPDEATIKERLSLVNYQSIVIDREKSTIFLMKRGMLIDLGGIAKGYIADRAVEQLKKEGTVSGIVAVAGDIRAFGDKPDRRPWRVGIRNPRQSGSDDEIMAMIELRDMAISTAGDYERFFIVDGNRYHHILDPKTGHPAKACRSVSVIAGEGVSADSYSTAVFILGPEKGIEVLRKMGFEGLIVDEHGKVHMSDGLRDRIEFKRPGS
jgi:FAD:protein FMN transferase